jgi:nucleotide-binding universal stress UspA family protein
MIEFKQIVCATDFSEPSLAALEFARSLAMRYGAKLTLLNVVDLLPIVATPRSGAAVATLDVAEFQQMMRENAAERLAELAEQHDSPDLEIATQVLEGKPSDEIVEFARDAGADLIVIATHGHSRWRRFLFGSVAEKVVRSATCPVLSIGPQKKD